MVPREFLEAVLCMIMMTFISGCAEFRHPGPTAGTYHGPSRDMGQGRAHAFITLDASGKPTVIGVITYDRFFYER